MTEDGKQNFSAPVDRFHQQAMNTAVRILSHREHSKYELMQKLQKRGFESSVINAVIAECERLNYINEPRTAKVYILQLKRKSFGRRYVRMALKKKRLGGAAVKNILQENYPEADEREYAGRLLKKKSKAFERERDLRKRRQKIYRFLYARGFSSAHISDLIRNMVK